MLKDRFSSLSSPLVRITEDTVLRDRFEALAEEPRNGNLPFMSDLEFVRSDETLVDGQHDRRLGSSGVNHWFLILYTSLAKPLVLESYEIVEVSESDHVRFDFAGDFGRDSVDWREVPAVSSDEDDMLEAVLIERSAVRADQLHQCLGWDCNRPREFHMMARATGSNRWRGQCVSESLGNVPGEFVAKERVHHHWEVWPVLLDRADGDDRRSSSVFERGLYLWPCTLLKEC